jgi:phosphomannomutase
MPVNIDSFKAYDIRGQIPNQINADICYRIGNATAAFLDADSVVVGRDMRLSSEEFAEAVCKGLSDAGVEVLDIGLCGTEMVYFATSFLQAGGGIMVTASHNPADYNGLKLVREGARPISADTGLVEIRAQAGRLGRQCVLPGRIRRLHRAYALVRRSGCAQASDASGQRRQRLRRARD